MTTNLLAALLAARHCVLYLGLYTPLKTRTTLATLVGAFPGAMPPLIGWAAARGSLGPGAWVLFAVLFLWQFPHFHAIAWMYREDYGRAGIRMLPVVDPEGRPPSRRFCSAAAALIPVSLLAAVTGLAGVRYFFRRAGRGADARGGLPVGRRAQDQRARQMADARHGAALAAAAGPDDVR